MIIWDTGPLHAVADSDDKDDARRLGFMRRTPPPLLMPAPVLAEVGYLLEREKGARAEAAFLRSIRTGQVMMIPSLPLISTGWPNWWRHTRTSHLGWWMHQRGSEHPQASDPVRGGGDQVPVAAHATANRTGQPAQVAGWPPQAQRQLEALEPVD